MVFDRVDAADRGGIGERRLEDLRGVDQTLFFDEIERETVLRGMPRVRIEVEIVFVRVDDIHGNFTGETTAST